MKVPILNLNQITPSDEFKHSKKVIPMDILIGKRKDAGVEEEDFNIDRPNVEELLADYSLFALRSCYDAYPEKGERIAKRIRTEKFALLRPKALHCDDPDALIRKKRRVKELHELESYYLSGEPTNPSHGSITMKDGSFLSDFLAPGDINVRHLTDKVIQEVMREKINKWGLKDGKFPSDLDSIDLAEGSIHTHRTPSILDENEVSFENRQGMLPQEASVSDEDYTEQDMVYYHKDDLTNYSKGLGLNKVKQKPNQNVQFFYNDNDIDFPQSNEEGESSDDAANKRKGIVAFETNLVFKRLQKKDGSGPQGSSFRKKGGYNTSKIEKSGISESKISGLEDMYIGESKHIGGISSMAADVPEDPNEQSYQPDSAQASFTKPNQEPKSSVENLP
jgi:hypothetical protein